MSGVAIKVEGLGKKYRIGAHQEHYKTLREALVQGSSRAFKRMFHSRTGQARNETIWALKDVSFEIKSGEVVGIIGRNGAGKSTLLKILSRITEPTEGSVEIRGRVGSLLEVGTGFHPELTGRENIYMNGSILGMRKAEIDRKFDEIVDFAEIEKFLDTPVKRYSSGMYVRLAFAVAAHLEPEILLVDEVLAVGDAAFQKKCLGKMGDVAKEGRTVLFVSHNMAAILSLCNESILLDSGRNVKRGETRSVINSYFKIGSRNLTQIQWTAENAPGNEEIKLTGIHVFSREQESSSIFSSKQDLVVEFEFNANIQHQSLCVGYDLQTPDGIVVLRSYQTDQRQSDWPHIRIGLNRWVNKIPGGLLNAGTYHICPRIGLHYMYWIIHLDPIIQFEVHLDHGVSPLWNASDAGKRPGIFAPILEWKELAI